MPPSANSAEAVTAHSFNKLLNQSSKRTPKEAEESVKKLRRLILIEGIPSAAVRIVRDQDEVIAPDVESRMER